MNTSSVSVASNRRSDEAANWHARLRSPECTTVDREAFEQWCIEDPANIDIWLEMSQLIELESELRNDLPIRSATRAAVRGSAHQREAQRQRRGFLYAAAAMLSIAIGLGSWYTSTQNISFNRYATTVGEQREFILDDGTRIKLDTDSVVSARFDHRSRRLDIERGRVDIVVAEDPDRALEVIAGRGFVRDIGTHFQVARIADNVIVTLLEGAVGVRLSESLSDETMLLAGQQISYGTKGALHAVRRADLDIAQGWTKGELVFKEARLDELLVELNRYSTKPLRLSDPALGAQKISGVFHVNDRASLLKALDIGWGLKVKNDSASEILIGRNDKTSR